MSARRSYRVEIPFVVTVADERAELLALVALDCEEHIEEAAAERIGHELRIRRALDGLRPVQRPARRYSLRVAIAGDRRTGIRLRIDAAQHTGEHQSGHQIRVRVGSGDAMLDMTALGRTRRHAQTHGAV